jgi:hypothetical protein
MLGSEDLLGLRGEGRIQTHEPIAVGNLGHGISAIEGLDPEERVGGSGTPRDSAWTLGFAVDGNLIGQGEGGDARYRVTILVPYLDLAGESPPGHIVGPRTDQTLDEEKLAIR